VTELEPRDEHVRVAFSTLSDYSIIQWSCEDDSYHMHQLVNSWSFERLSAGEVHLFGTAAVIMLMNEEVPSPGALRNCLSKIASIPNASSSDRLVTLERFGTRGAHHEKRHYVTRRSVTPRPALRWGFRIRTLSEVFDEVFGRPVRILVPHRKPLHKELYVKFDTAKDVHQPLTGSIISVDGYVTISIN
jgi:hypothetical protein